MRKPLISFNIENLRMKKIFIALFQILLWCTTAAMAQDVQFTALAKTAVLVGENFQLQYKINAEGTGFQGPALSDFQVVSGPGTSTSSSVQIINGQVSRDVSYVFTYILRGVKEGTFTIPAATISYQGKQYASNSFTIKVLKGNSSSSSSGSGQSAQSSNENDVFIKAYISNNTPVQGEQVIITYKIFTTIPISNIDASKISSFPGFWATDLLSKQEAGPQSREMVNGKEYVTAEIKKFALVPQRNGVITIDAGEINCVAQIRTQAQKRNSDPFFDSFFNDPFFNSRYQNVEKKLMSNPLKIDVKPLPGNDKPDFFSGAVGSFQFDSQIDRTEVKANEAITLKYTLKGKGNIELIDPPMVNFPTDFEVYDPEVKNSIKSDANGVSGVRTFEYLIIPRNPGNYTIKSVQFAYFDISKREYVSTTTPEYKINVSKGDGSSSSAVYSGSTSQEDIKYIGKDIRHIKLSPYDLRPSGSFFFKSGTYYFLLALPLILFILVLIIWHKNVERRSNVALMKNRRATKVSRKRLQAAFTYLKESKENEFYIEISKALWGYLSDKFTIPRAELSVENVKERLMKKSVSEEIINQFIETLNNTEFARFAPGNKSQNMENIYNEALSLIIKIERELK